MSFGAALRDDVKEAFARRLASNLCCGVNLDAARETRSISARPARRPRQMTHKKLSLVRMSRRLSNIRAIAQ